MSIISTESLIKKRWMPSIPTSLIWCGFFCFVLKVAQEWLAYPQQNFPYKEETELAYCVFSPLAIRAFDRFRVDRAYSLVLALTGVLVFNEKDFGLALTSLLGIVFVLALTGSFLGAAITCIACIFGALNLKADLQELIVLGLWFSCLASLSWLALHFRGSPQVHQLTYASIALTTAVASVLIFLFLKHRLIWDLVDASGLVMTLAGTNALIAATAVRSSVVLECFSKAILIASPLFILLTRNLFCSYLPVLQLFILGAAFGYDFPDTKEEASRTVGQYSGWRTFGICVMCCGLLLSMIGLWGMWWGEVQLKHWMKTSAQNKFHLVSADQINYALRDCTLAAEDRGFYQHHGFDFIAIHRALRHNIRNHTMKEGGSTISMQAARYAFAIGQKSMTRKISEACLTAAMEHLYSKETILRIYFSTADYGYSQVGVDAAARFYFGKSSSKVDLAEAIFLAEAVNHPPNSKIQLRETLAMRQVVADRLQGFDPSRFTDTQIQRAAVVPSAILFRRSSKLIGLPLKQ